MPLKLIKTTVEAGLYNLLQNFPACACQDLDMHMRDPRTISVDSLLSSIYQSYTDSEKLSIQNQISLLEIPSEGLRYDLDPKVCLHGDRQNHGSVTVEAAPLQTSLNDRMSLRSSAAVPIHCASYADILNLLLKKYSYLQLQKIPFRLSGFSKDIYGLLHESPYGCANYLGC